MRSNGPSFRLTDSVDASVLQELQDSLAALAQVSISVCDTSGWLITRPSCGSPLCGLLNESPAAREACIREVEARAVAVADRVAGAGPVPKAAGCWAGLETIGLPIELDGHHLGTVVVGDSPHAPLNAKRLKQLARDYALDQATVSEAARQLGTRTEEQRQAARRCAGLLARSIAQMCRQDLMLRERVEELTAVYNIAGLLSGTEDLKASLNTTARIVTEVTRAKACAIRLLDEATGELVMTAVHNLSDEYLNKGPVLRGENPIDDAALAGETVYVADSATDPRIRYPEQSRREGLVSALCAPMTHRGQTVGVIRAYTGRPHKFSLLEASLLRAIGSQAAAAIVTARLLAQRREADRYHRQLQYAGEIQRRMVPAEPPTHKNITFAGVYAPSLEVGGDFYDFIPLARGNLGLVVADVVGSGVPAALMMASVRSALRSHAHSIYEINEVMAQVNRHLFRDTLISEFATLCYGVFSPDGGRFTYCNAGHEPPLLLRADEFRRLEVGGMVIGVSAEATFDKEMIDLQPGDILVFVTDGVTEALNFQGEQFGRPRLRESILRYRREDARSMANQVLWDVRRFTGLARQTDDLTVVVAKVADTD